MGGTVQNGSVNVVVAALTFMSAVVRCIALANRLVAAGINSRIWRVVLITLTASQGTAVTGMGRFISVNRMVDGLERKRLKTVTSVLII